MGYGTALIAIPLYAYLKNRGGCRADSIYFMLEDNYNGKHWKYKAGQKKYAVDCIGMICYCAEQFFTEQAFKYTYNVKKGTRLARDINIPKDDKKKPCLYPINGNYDSIPRGAIVYYKDYTHVGVYIGAMYAPDGTYYEHAVIHSEKSSGVHVTEIEERSGFSFYCLYNYIDYQYNTSVEVPYSPFLVIDDSE